MLQSHLLRKKMKLLLYLKKKLNASLLVESSYLGEFYLVLSRPGNVCVVFG